MKSALGRSRFAAPDFFFGKALGVGKMIVESFALLIRQPSLDTCRFLRKAWRVKPRFTMLSVGRLFNLHLLARRADEEGIRGDIVECGSWNGGCAALVASGTARNVWVFDSFQGLPTPTAEDGTDARDFEGLNFGSEELVREAFAALGVPQPQTRIVKGWFQDTLPIAEVREIAILHVDADWYESVWEVIRNLYPSLVPGGFVIFDDYGQWPGCRKAVDEFMAQHGREASELARVSWSNAVWLRKR